MNKRIVFLIVAALLVSTFIIVQAAPPLPGAIFTTTEDGTIVNENTRYKSKQDVYLDGGPGPNAPPKAAGLPKGDYFFQVTDPSGKDLLSSDHISCRKFHVNNHGVIDKVYDGTNYVWNDSAGQWDAVSCKHKQGVDVDHADLGAITVQLYPYDDTPNRGGEYKAWATPVKDYAGDPNFVPVDENDAVNGENYQSGNFHGFIPAKSKTDNYKVRKERVPTIIEIDVDKTADPTEVNEPGGEVTFYVKVVNDSPVEVTLNSLVDNIHGDLNGKGDCSVPQTLGPGESYECSFKATVEGDAGDSETDTVTACAVDEENNKGCDKDNATVEIIKPEIIIDVTKTADPTQLPEPGGEVTFSVLVENKSGVSVIITSLVDDIHGDLNGQGNCSVPQSIAAGGSYSCSFDGMVVGNAGHSETDTVTACTEGDEVCDEDNATVTIIDVLPNIEVIKTVDPETRIEPGGVFTFTVEIKNLSSPTDPVTITSLVDNIHGDLDGKGSCDVPQTIQASSSYICTFSEVITDKSAGYTETDTVTAEGTDDEGNPVKDEDSAEIEITGTSPCPVAGEFTIGYEDVPLDTEWEDYDYNDWITDMLIELAYADEECNLDSINFVITPEARGALYDHAFYIAFPPDVFDSNGTTMLSIYDANGNIMSEQSFTFTADQKNEYLIFAHTNEVFGDLVNTTEFIEGEPVDPNMTAELTIDFTTPFQFNLNDYNLENPHGANLFFDPWIDVDDGFGTDYSVHAGDPAILTIPLVDWLYSEEHRAIYVSYPDVTVDLFFPPNWYENYNDCVYNDVICTLP